MNDNFCFFHSFSWKRERERKREGKRKRKRERKKKRKRERKKKRKREREKKKRCDLLLDYWTTVCDLDFKLSLFIFLLGKQVKRLTGIESRESE